EITLWECNYPSSTTLLCGAQLFLCGSATTLPLWKYYCYPDFWKRNRLPLTLSCESGVSLIKGLLVPEEEPVMYLPLCTQRNLSVSGGEGCLPCDTLPLWEGD